MANKNPIWFQLATILAWLMAISSSWAIETPAAPHIEKRIFQVKVDNKVAGGYQLRFTTSGDSIDVSSHSQVDVHFLVFHYHYDYSGHELWKGAHLVSFSSDSVDGGKRCTIKAERTGNTLTLNVDGKLSQIKADTLTSSYFRIPANGAPSADFLEVDSGRLFAAQLQYLGEESLQINGKREVCKHYKLTGGDSCELWYDSLNRLAKQSSDNNGHRTIVELEHIDYLD